jgi:hypothetical protein
VPVFGFIRNVLPFPVSESYVLGLLVCVSGAVSCCVLSDGVHSLRYVSMRGDRIVWVVRVRVVMIGVVSLVLICVAVHWSARLVSSRLVSVRLDACCVCRAVLCTLVFVSVCAACWSVLCRVRLHSSVLCLVSICSVSCCSSRAVCWSCCSSRCVVVSCGVRDGAVPTCAVDVYGRVWLIRFVRQCVSLRLVSLLAESFRFVSIRVGRIVWIVHVVRVVSCMFVLVHTA